MTEFQAWPKTPRLYRDIVITEKIDGTNSAIVIEEHHLGDEQSPDLINVVPYLQTDGSSDTEFHLFAQSRKHLITPASDSFGFAQWVADNAATLVADLGAGRHFGEWWGQGIQRKYGMDRKVFSLFNTRKWMLHTLSTPNLDIVPVLYHGPMDSDEIDAALDELRDEGSLAALDQGRPKFDNPEGICVFHTAANTVFKVTLENDEAPKSIFNS